jgi:hypothetical protein
MAGLRKHSMFLNPTPPGSSGPTTPPNRPGGKRE